MNYYLAKVFIRQCTAEIRINDMPVLRRSVDGDLTVQIPVNYLIESSGPQTLTVQVFPVFGSTSLRQGSLCSIEVWRYDGSGQKIIPVNLACSSELIIGENDVILPYKQDIKVFKADVSHHILRWSDCIEIEDNRQTTEEVVAFFQMAGQMLANKQYDRYADLISKREKDICTALSLDAKGVSERNERLFRLLNDGFVWQPLRAPQQLGLYAHNRVATLIDVDFKSALKFKNRDTGQILSIDLLLGKKGENAGFHVI